MQVVCRRDRQTGRETRRPSQEKPIELEILHGMEEYGEC
jgi:hypothetical protein